VVVGERHHPPFFFVPIKKVPMIDLRGWFNFRPVYDWVADHFSEAEKKCDVGTGSTSVVTAPVLVEVGVWKGTSIIHLCKQLLDRMGCNFELYAVDTFEISFADGTNGGDEYNLQIKEMLAANRTLLDVFGENIKAFDLEDHIEILCMDSVRAVPVIRGADFVFIDGDHTTEAVISDINAWKGRTGILAGHDAYQDSVRDALVACFGENGYWASINSGGCWTTHPLLGEHIVGLSEGTDCEEAIVRKEDCYGNSGRKFQEVA